LEELRELRPIRSRRLDQQARQGGELVAELSDPLLLSLWLSLLIQEELLGQGWPWPRLAMPTRQPRKCQQERRSSQAVSS